MVFPFILEKNYNFLWDFYKFISPDSEIWIEIGSGNGDYLVEIAKRNPNDIFIGVEIKYKRLLKTLKKVKKNKLTNVILFHTSGETFVNFILKDNSVSSFIFNFPDPWFKKKHHKRKILNTKFILDLLPKLKKNGKIYIATDYEDYAYEIANLVENISILKNLNSTTFGNKWLYQDVFTKYERDFINQGKKIFYLFFKKL